MGNEVRAKELSEKFNNRLLRAVAAYGFRCCGNCVNRLKCGEEILSNGKKKEPLKYIVDSMMEGCPKANYKTKGFIAKETSKFLQEVCSNCEKRDICVGYVADHVGRSETEEKEKVQKRMEECLKCKDLDNCIQHYLIQLGVSNVGLLRRAFLTKFRKCSQENMMTISLDLPANSETNVGGLVRTRKKKPDD